eukprot:scaffold9158_cov72-Cylindrotheca_fusiformis.AAC.5
MNPPRILHRRKKGPVESSRQKKVVGIRATFMTRGTFTFTAGHKVNPEVSDPDLGQLSQNAPTYP